MQHFTHFWPTWPEVPADTTAPAKSPRTRNPDTTPPTSKMLGGVSLSTDNPTSLIIQTKSAQSAYVLEGMQNGFNTL